MQSCDILPQEAAQKEALAAPNVAANNSLNRKGRRALGAQNRQTTAPLAAALTQLKSDIGHEPSAANVAALIEQALFVELIHEGSRAEAQRVLASLRGGNPDRGELPGYALAVNWLREGTATERALAWLEAMFEPSGGIELRALAPTGKHGGVSCCGTLADQRAELGAFISNWQGVRSVYVGCNPRIADLGGTTRAASAEHVATRRWAVVDLDDRPAGGASPDWTQTRALLDDLSPAAVVTTGNGTHHWFRVAQSDGADVDALTAGLNAAMTSAGGDAMADIPRIARLPCTLNLPTAQKRARGAAVTMALPLDITGPPGGVSRTVPDLIAALEGVATATGRAVAQAPATGGGASTRVALEQLRAPDWALLRDALLLLPNDDTVCRDEQVRVAHAVAGASRATEFESEARDAFLEWSARFPFSDPDADARIYDTLGAVGMGFPHLVAALRGANPSGAASLDERLRAHTAEAARVAFAEHPLSPADTEHVAETAEAADKKQKTDKVGKPGKIPPHEQAVASLVADGARVFEDRKGTVWLSHAGRLYNVSAKDPALFQLAARKGFNVTGTARGNLAETLGNRVNNTMPREEVHFRQAQIDENGQPATLINLMDSTGRGVRVSALGWVVTPLVAFPAHMTNRKGAMPLPTPVSSSSNDGLFDILERHIPLAPFSAALGGNLAGVRQRAVLLALMASAFSRPGTVPHVMVSGHQGTGKTTLARRLVALMDPDAAAVSARLPSEPEKLFPLVTGRLCMVVDNASGISGGMSDVLCAIASGTAHQSRKLYTDSDRAILEAKASIIFTSVLESIAKQPDLAQRMLRFEPQSLPGRRRMTEGELDAKWAADYPAVFAALLDALVGMFRHLPGVQAEVQSGVMNPPRLADASVAAEAMARGLGWPDGLCMKALQSSEKAALALQLEQNPVAWRIRHFVEAQLNRSWSGSFAELEIAVDNTPPFAAPPWDRNRLPFKGQYDRLRQPLSDAWGIEIASRKVAKGQRMITISCTGGGDESDV